MIYCSNCGKSIPADSKFCTFCGAAVPAILTENVAPKTARSRPYAFADHRGDFIRSAGFWGSLLVLAGFFLPWLHGTANLTGLEMVTNGFKVGKYILLIFPLCGLFILTDSLTNFLPSGAAILFKVLPFLLLLVFVILILMGNKQHAINLTRINVDNLESFAKITAIGLWLTVIGSIIMLGHKKYTRV
ncbi:MAG: zinc ribbon domain-containing protein [Ginsengibacter sp.]